MVCLWKLKGGCREYFCSFAVGFVLSYVVDDDVDERMLKETEKEMKVEVGLLSF